MNMVMRSVGFVRRLVHIVLCLCQCSSRRRTSVQHVSRTDSVVTVSFPDGDSARTESPESVAKCLKHETQDLAVTLDSVVDLLRPMVFMCCPRVC